MGKPRFRLKSKMASMMFNVPEMYGTVDHRAKNKTRADIVIGQATRKRVTRAAILVKELNAITVVHAM